MNCETLTPNARKIFDRIKKYYPLGAWGELLWKDEGLVYDNGWLDLRKAEARSCLIERYERQIGAVLVASAKDRKERGREITGSVFNFILSQRWIELVVLLHELDFQIETLDLVEEVQIMRNGDGSPNVSYGPRLPEPPFGEVIIPEDLKDKGILNAEQSKVVKETLGFAGTMGAIGLMHNPGRGEINLRFENQRLREELSKAKIRAGQLSVQLMRSQAESSETQATLKRWHTELEIVAGQKGHNPCFADVLRLLKNTIGYTGRYPDPDDITPEEFANGCVAFHGGTFGECGVRLVVVKEDKK